MLAGEAFEMFEGAFLFEHGEIAFERERGVEDAGAAARRFLGFASMGRAVGAEEELGRTRDCGAAKRKPVLFALGDRKAIGVRADAASEHRVAVDMEVLRGNRGG